MFYKDTNLFCTKINTQNREMTTWKWLKWGTRWEARGVICGRVFLKSTSQNHRLGSRGAQFTEERITTPDYLSRVIKAVLPNSIITHLKENKRAKRGGVGEMEGEEGDKQLFSHPLCYCALVDLPDGFQDFRDYYLENCLGVHSSLQQISCTNTNTCEHSRKFSM